MSDLRSLPKFSFGDIEKYIKDNLDKICGGTADKHMKNSMMNEKSYALHSEKRHILRIIIKTDGSTADITSNVKHSLSSVIAQCDCKYGNSGFCSHVCSLLYRLASYQLRKLDFLPDEDFSSTIGACSWRAPKPNNMGNMSATEMNWTVHRRTSSKSTIPSSNITSKVPLYQACAPDLRSPPELNILKQLKISCDTLNLPFSTLLDHAIEQQQPLTTININFGPTYSISSLANHQHEHTDTGVLFFIADCNQTSYHKDNKNYPSFPLKPMPSLNELKLSNDDVWWTMDIVVSYVDSVALEANTTGQRSSQQWRDAHTKRISASQVGSILNRVRAPTDCFVRNLFNSFNDSKISTIPRSVHHGIENESKALNEYKKGMMSNGYQVEIFASGFVTQPDYFWLGATPDAKVRSCEGDKITFGIAEVKCPYSARFLKPS
ncbi:unnamed protein product [Rotaria sp. Silwood1]|nr:unnamed protein product [Rotaria sp. Silwood1]CAF3799914.1 unnamed protein product [Rotaria sp. Silwood1]CAF3887430.1 unnamed protein product [Rotaria sp. Silwood1]